MNRRAFASAFGFFCILLAAAAADAQNAPASEADTELARSDALFRDGVRLSKEGDLSAACENFEQSYRLAPRPGTLLNVGICHQELGHLLSARRELLEARTILSEREGPSQRVANADDKLREIDAALGWIHVVPRAAQDGAFPRLLLDGAVVTTFVPDQPLPVMPGEHTVRLEAEGYEPLELSAVVGRGMHTQMAFESLRRTAPVPNALLVPVVPAPSQQRTAFTAADSLPGARSDFATPRLVALVVGSLGIATGLAFGAWALDRKNALEEKCPNRTCRNPNDLQIADMGRTVALVSTIAFGTGVAGFGMWVILPGGLLNQSVSSAERGRVGITLRTAF